MADVPFPPHSGSRAFVLEGTKADVMRISTPSCNGTTQNCEPSRDDNGAKVGSYLVVMML